MFLLILGFVIVLILFFVIVDNVKVVPQSYAYIVENLGAYKDTWEVGIHIKTPFVERIVRKVPLKEQLVDFQPTRVITKDNVTITVDSVIFFQITDPKLFTYGVERPIEAINQLTNTTLRNIFGGLEFDNALTSRDLINERAKEVLDAATDPWGIKVNRVELKQIAPPPDIQEAMERQMKAERIRREKILEAEGTKTSAILKAEADKESTLRRAEAEKQAAVMKAEAEKQVIILKAEADAEREVKAAQAKAEAIQKVRDAEAYALKQFNDLGLTNQTLKLRSLETMEKVADGQATKLIIPSDLQNVVTMFAAGKEVLSEVKHPTPQPAKPVVPNPVPAQKRVVRPEQAKPQVAPQVPQQ